MASSSLGQCPSKAEHPHVFIGIVGLGGKMIKSKEAAWRSACSSLDLHKLLRSRRKSKQ